VSLFWPSWPGCLAVLSGVHALQALGIFPYVLGPFRVHDFSFWSFMMWGLLVWVYVWVVQMLWRLEKDAWLIPGCDHDLQSDPGLYRHAG